MLATIVGSKMVVQLLLNSVADVETRDKAFRTPSSYTIMPADRQIVQLLLAWKARQNRNRVKWLAWNYPGDTGRFQRGRPPRLSFEQMAEDGNVYVHREGLQQCH